jgi:hypothetical protein
VAAGVAEKANPRYPKKVGMAQLDLREELKRDLRRHPRVEMQGLLEAMVDRAKIAQALPIFAPFKGKTYKAVLWVADWDHRLPSQNIIMRLYAYYNGHGKRVADESFGERMAHITSETIFPEFDVSDFAGLPADEIYEAEGPVGGELKTFHLVSEWRREIEPPLARKAEQIVRASAHFREIASQTRARPPGLGDLEAAEWSPPSESGYKGWGLDVWYLRAFNGMVGEGTAFLVDLDLGEVVRQRDFQFRAG